MKSKINTNPEQITVINSNSRSVFQY